MILAFIFSILIEVLFFYVSGGETKMNLYINCSFRDINQNFYSTMKNICIYFVCLPMGRKLVFFLFFHIVLLVLSNLITFLPFFAAML